MIPCRFCGSMDEGLTIDDESNICPHCVLTALTAAMELHELRSERFTRETSARKRRVWRAVRDKIHYRPMR